MGGVQRTGAIVILRVDPTTNVAHVVGAPISRVRIFLATAEMYFMMELMVAQPTPRMKPMVMDGVQLMGAMFILKVVPTTNVAFVVEAARRKQRQYQHQSRRRSRRQSQH